jgi:hypothetical protein
MYYSNPIPGKAYKPFSKFANIIVEKDKIYTFKFKKMIFFNREIYVIFKNDNQEEIMQSLKSIKFLRLKIGEDNYQSKLSDIERVEIYNKANDGVKAKELSEQYKISESQVYNIKNLISGSKAIENVINNKEKNIPNTMVAASNKTNKKFKSNSDKTKKLIVPECLQTYNLKITLLLFYQVILNNHLHNSYFLLLHLLFVD